MAPVWNFICGEIRPAETYDAALEREVARQAGLSVRMPAKIEESRSFNGKVKLHWLHTGLFGAEQEFHLNPDEIIEARWLAPKEALALEPLFPPVKIWLERKR